jgi:hypothetical protein
MRHIEQFNIYWWVASDDTRLCRLATRTPQDIERFSDTHFRVKAHPISTADGEVFDFVLRLDDGIWTVRSKAFDEPVDYPYTFADGADHSVWTDALDDELMVIRGSHISEI